MEVDDMKGQLGYAIFVVLVAFIILGLIAPFASELFNALGPQFSDNIVLVILAIGFPMFAIIYLFGLLRPGGA
jgi:uncharacterized membrane protein